MSVKNTRSQLFEKMYEETSLIESREEEYRLLELAKNGDQEAKNTLVSSNLRLVAHTVTHYARFSNLEWEDLFQEGSLGLYRAIDKFDTSKGFAFSTYATWWIRQACQKLVQTNSRIVRVPTKVDELYREYNKVRNEYFQEFSRYPTDDEICTLLGITRERLHVVLTTGQQAMSLDQEVVSKKGGKNNFDGTPDTLKDSIRDTNAPDINTIIDSSGIILEVQKALATLTEVEREVLLRRTKALGDEESHTLKSLVDDGTIANTAQGNVIHARAIAKFKEYFGGVNPLENVDKIII